MLLMSVSPVAIAPFLIVAALGVHLASKHIEAVAHMEHRIRVDTVIACVASAGCSHIAFIETLPPTNALSAAVNNCTDTCSIGSFESISVKCPLIVNRRASCAKTLSVAKHSSTESRISLFIK